MACFSPPFLRGARIGAGVAAVLVGLSLVGCVRLLEPRQNDITYYLLEGRANADTLSADTTGLKVGLRRPQLASYLDAARIVTRYGPHKIQFSEFHRWGEDLEQGLNRVTALLLEARPGIQSVVAVPWPEGTSFDYVVQLDVLRFEGRAPELPGPKAKKSPQPKGYSQMVVRWTILGPDGETVLTHGVTRHRKEGWPVTDYGALVSRLDTSLAVLARDIAERLRALKRR